MNSATSESVRIAVLLDGDTQPAWLCAALEKIRSLPFVEICLIFEKTISRRKSARPGLWPLYRHVDDRLFARSANALAPRDVTDLFRDIPRRPLDPALFDAFGFADYDLDIVWDLGTGMSPSAVAGVSRLGLWRYEFDNEAMHDPSAVGRREVFDQAPLTVSSLVGYQPDGQRLCLYRSQSRTVPYSPRRNRDNVYWKSSAFVQRALLRLHQSKTFLPMPEHANCVATRAAESSMATALLRAGGNLLGRGWQKLTAVEQWFVAFKFGTEPDLPQGLSGFQSLIPPKDRFWADPFPIKRDGRYFIFIEELPFTTNKGHISVLEVWPDGRSSVPVKVLERDYHLSYPFLFEWQGVLYMLPETGQNRTVEVYRCHRFPDDWRLEKVLLSNVLAADATLFQAGDVWWMFVNIGEEGTELYDELHLFHAEQPFGTWEPHRLNPVKSDAMSARPAGRPFLVDGALYRPAQVCAPLYGSAIALNKVERIDSECFVEREVVRLTPDWLPGLAGCHTYNRSDGLTVVDGFKQTPRFLS